MLRLYEFGGPVVFVFWVFCVVDVILSPETSVRNLPKMLWLLLVLFFPLVGGIAWLVAGRPVQALPRSRAERLAAAEFPEYDRPGRASGVTPESDAEFLRQIRERAEDQRRRAAEERRRQETED